MSEQDERETLASVIERAYDGRVFGSYGADAVLASDWLAEHDRRVEARALRDLPVVLAEYVRTSGQSGVSIAQEAGITTKHLSQMVNHHVGSVDAWLRVIHAIDRLNDRADRLDPDAARGERGAGR